MVSRLRHSLSQLILNVIHLLNLRRTLVVSYSGIGIWTLKFWVRSANDNLCLVLNAEFDPRIVGLTGPISAVRQIAQEYRVFFKRVEEVGQDYLVESSHNM